MARDTIAPGAQAADRDRRVIAPLSPEEKTGSRVDVSTLQQALDTVFDQALVYHAYTDYMRDYEMILYLTADPVTGVPPIYLRYLFRYCVEACIRTSVHRDVWRASLDDRLLGDSGSIDQDGYVWGVKWQCLYPGGMIVPASRQAREWSEALGIDFHEVRFETNGHDITLVFSDLQVTELPIGYTPFTAIGH
ncbi:hypothetical protein ABZ860_04340 [Microbispora sp. NPDC046973]|uniref:YxiG-like protein n=1 Tax=Microbispora sp. NPDC046973 TaxID=3155022 RepID=UPI0033FECF48